MASGKLGTASLAVSTWTSVYTVPANKVATVNIRMVNSDMINPVSVRLALSMIIGAAANSDYIVPKDFVLPAGGIMEESALVMSPGEIVNAFASNNQVAVRVHGFETPILPTV